MDALIQRKYFIGKSIPGVWSSVYEYKPQSSEIRNTHGQIFAAICLKGPKEFSLPTAGNMLLDRFHEVYFENKEDKTLISLEKALLETGKYLQKILENDTAADIGIDLNLISMVINKDILYVSSLGKGKLYAYRDGDLTDITEALRDPTGEGLVREASLVAKKGDVYLLGTPELDQEILKDELLKVAREFTDQPLRTRFYQNEANIGLMIVGYNIDRNREIKEKPMSAVEVVPEVELATQEGVEVQPEVIIDEVITKELMGLDEVDKELPETSMESESQGSLETQTDYQEEGQQGSGLGWVDNDNIDGLDEPLGDVAEYNAKPSFKTKLTGAVTAGGNKLTGFFKGIKGKIVSLKKPARKNVFQPESIQEVEREVKIETDIEPTLEAQDLTIGELVAKEKEKDVPLENRKTYQVILIKIRNFIWGVLVGIKKLVWDKWLGMSSGDNIYLRSAARKRKWGFLVVLILVIIGLLYYSVQGVLDNQKQKAKEETAMTLFTEAKNMISVAKTTSDTLAKSTRREDAKNQVLTDLQKAQTKLDQAKLSDSLASDIKAQESLIVNITDKLSKSIVLNTLNLLTDFGDKFPDADPTDMVLYDKKLYITDAKFNNITSSDYSGNRTEIANGFKAPRSISVDDKKNLVVLDSNADNQLSLVNIENKEVTRLAATSESKVGGSTQVEFANIGGEGRIYLLENRDKAIAYYSRTKTSYTTIKIRNTMDELATAKDLFIIDGKIYLLMQKDFGLYRDAGQKQDQMNLVDFKTEDNMLSATALYVDGVNIYVADPSNKRVLVFNKTGFPDTPFVAQYVYRGSDPDAFTDIKEITADRDSLKIFVLDGTNVYVLDMASLNDFTN